MAKPSVLFIVPPYRTTDGLVNGLYPMPLGPVLLSTILQARGHKVAVKDFLVPKQRKYIAKPESFRNLRSPFYGHWGASFEECFTWLDHNLKQWDVVCLALG